MKPNIRIPMSKNAKIGNYKITAFLGSSYSSMIYEVQEQKTEKTFLLKEFYPAHLVEKGDIWYNPIIEKIQPKNNLQYYFAEYQKELEFICDTAYLDEKLEQLQDRDYLLMNLPKGRLLRSFMYDVGAFSTLDDVIRFMISSLNSLRHIHCYGYIHGNISPDNLYIFADGEVRIIDLVGITELEDKANLKAYETRYTPIEYAVKQRNDNICYGSDIYMVASVVFQILYDSYFNILQHSIYKKRSTRRLVIDEKIHSPYFTGESDEKIDKLRGILSAALIDRYENCDSAIAELMELI